MWKKMLIPLMLSLPAWGYNLTQDFNNGFYWSSLPIKITVVESDSTKKSTMESLAKSAIGEWESRTGFNLWEFTQSSTSAASSNIIRWSTNFAAETGMDASSVLAVAIRYTSGPYFAKTEIVINGGHYLNRDVDNLLTTITHELGHTMGLDHSNVSQAVMAPTLQSPYYGLASDDIQGMDKAEATMSDRQLTGYVSPLSYSKDSSSGSGLGCGTVATTPAMSYNSMLSLALGALTGFVRKIFRWVKSLF
jgi:Matrixin